MRRRDFIKVVAGAASALPVAAHAQPSTIPLVGYLTGGSLPDSDVIAFRHGLNESGYVEGQNVIVEYRWAEGQHDRLPALSADLARRQVCVIASRMALLQLSRPRPPLPLFPSSFSSYST